MKKVFKVILIILLVIVLITGGIVIWQWDNIESIVLGVRENSEQINKRREENQTKLVDDVNSHMDEPLRELTEEEKTQIEEGSVAASEVYQKIFEEKVQSSAEKAPVTEEKSPTAEPPSELKETKDEIISRYMVEFYKLQNEFNARAEATILDGAGYYESIKAHPQDPVARANTITHFTPVVRGIEKECDAKFDALLSQLEAELKAIGSDTSVIVTIKNTYKNEKQLKLSYYANKYLK